MMRRPPSRPAWGHPWWWLVVVSVVSVASDDVCTDSPTDQSVVLPLQPTKDVWHRSQYYAPVELGTPPKRFQLMVDSGSFDLSVQGHICST